MGRNKVFLSNANRKASRNKNIAIDRICKELQKFKKKKDFIEYCELIEVVERPKLSLTPPELEYTGRQTIIIRINGGDRKQEREIMLEGK